MVKRKESFSRLSETYLFADIHRRKEEYLAAHPEAELISLGIGDTTQPIPQVVTNEMSDAAKRLSVKETYTGYGPGAGEPKLREAIATNYYHDKVAADEVFISDGAKSDLGRVQELFGAGVSIAVQDPAYPVYVDGSLLQGVKEIVPLPCLPENHFFPDLNNAPRTDLIYFCSPNNPTGVAATTEQLIDLVAFAEANRSVIIYDAAYANFITDSSLPKTIFDIPGARNVAIELNSFSKSVGFTGVRLGWTVVPKELCYDGGESIRSDWNRVVGTIFNGASNIAQQGGIAALSPEGEAGMNQLSSYYLNNAKILKDILSEQEGFEVYGGDHAPYIWLRVPGKSSWELFQFFLEKLQLVTTPGVGLGPTGEGFVRFSAFAHKEQIEAAAKRIASLKESPRKIS